MERDSLIIETIKKNLDDTKGPIESILVSLLELCQDFEKNDYHKIEESKKMYHMYLKKETEIHNF